MADDNFIVPFDEASLGPPPKLTGAPSWAQSISDRLHAIEIRQQSDRHKLGGDLFRLQGDIGRIDEKLGKEPNSDGKDGEGLIGDVRKLARDQASLMSLRDKGLGFIAAIALCGAVLIAGLVHLVQAVTHTAGK